MRKYKYELRSVPLTERAVAESDAVLIVTNHDAVDYRLLGSAARLIVDTRNAMKSISSPRARIVKA
jgi:UDP-N-acetyl-D-glucosamine dehydrogenase